MSSTNRNDAILKSLLLAILAFVPLVSYIVAFYSMDYKLQVIKTSKSDKDRLPELNMDNFSEKLVNGLKYYLVVLIYSLPLSVLVFALLFVFFIPFIFLPVIFEDQGGLFLAFLACFGVLLTIGISLITTFWNSFVILPATYLYQKKEDIGEALRFAQVWNMRSSTKVLAKRHFFSTLLVNTVIMLVILASIPLMMICIGIVPYFLGLILSFLFSIFVFPHFEGRIFKVWEDQKL